MNNFFPVFDGHNDVLSRLWQEGGKTPEAFFFDEACNFHITAAKAKKGGLAGGLCAVFPPSPEIRMENPDDRPPVDHSAALQATLAMAALLTKLARHAPDQFHFCRSITDIQAAFKAGAFAATFHIEGAEAISHDLDELYVLHAAGLRSIGPVWSRNNFFGAGVPFSFPASPDIGPGLTETGKRLIRACNQLKIMVDLSHMNEKGFWDIAKLSNAPLVATHSNAHALSPHSRNLTDKQLDAIGESGGLVGINYGVIFLREDGERSSDTPLATIIAHIRYIADRIGIDHVALGSDFDGTTLPDQLSDATKLPDLIHALQKAGFDDAALKKMTHQNWLRVLEKSWA